LLALAVVVSLHLHHSRTSTSSKTVVVQSAGPERSDDANSLFSKSSIRLIDVISEGEIEGFRNA
jgi:hypothetical protein